MVELMFRLLCGHAIADYALQNDFVGKNKNRNAVPIGYDPKLHGAIQKVWPYVLTSHALIHGAAAYVATGLLWVGLAETAAHWAIDFGKCEKWYGIHTDQWLHIGFKILWCWLVLR
jgi:hypothetical protein